ALSVLSVVLTNLPQIQARNDEGETANAAVIESARMLLANVRETDLVFRWEDDEFLVLLCEADLAACQKKVHQLAALFRPWRETPAVALGALLLALLTLRADSRWTHGVLGDQDAWQNLWNLDHVARALRGEAPLLRTDRLFAPEGASLLAHTLSLTNTLPGAL